MDKIVLVYAHTVTAKSAANIRQDGRTKLSSTRLPIVVGESISSAHRDRLV